MKNIKNLISIILVLLLLSHCSSFYEKKRQNKSEEFLIEKKSPLVIPPEFEKLPLPNSKDIDNNEDEKVLVIFKDGETTKNPKNSDVSGSLEESILKKIENN